ncbi:MAG TPA: glutamate synthase, partial [Verrucomicrobiales bacterium]|nr:glutamate synthase [Verrucomicrobiales bacterium]
MKFRIDNQEMELESPVSILEAARRIGIEIPALCYQGGMEHFTSCMICVVKEKKSGRLLPACSAPVAEGMEIETGNDEVRAFRKSTLELLLSDHVGDCEAPCQRLCPLHMEIPRMIRETLGGRLEDAIQTVRRDIAIPSILERFCNVPCERGCRRGKHDEPISIRQLTRHAADWDLRRESPYIPPRQAPLSGKRVAIVGAGATGLAASHYLSVLGHSCTVLERSGRLGGRIEAEFKREIEGWVAEGELRILRALGVEFQFNATLGASVLLPDLRERFDAVLIACGKSDPAALAALGLPAGEKGLKVNPATWQTEMPSVFAAGSVLKPGQPLIKSVIAAKEAAACIDQHLRGVPVVGIVEMYNHIMGRLLEGEMEVFLGNASPIPRVVPSGGEEAGYPAQEAATEATRCLHCDCRAKDDCLLRIYSDEYDAKQSQFAGEERAGHTQLNQQGQALYEPGKCIKCGLCVRVTEKEGEPIGFAYVGRGFDVKIGAALDKPVSEAMGHVVEKVVAACPTGALAINEKGCGGGCCGGGQCAPPAPAPL